MSKIYAVCDRTNRVQSAEILKETEAKIIVQERKSAFGFLGLIYKSERPVFRTPGEAIAGFIEAKRREIDNLQNKIVECQDQIERARLLTPTIS